MEKTETEFDVLVQRTKQRIVIGERIGESLRLFQRSSESVQSVSKREIISRKFRDLRQGIPFLKKFR